jgi:hypothetical protein
VALSKRRIAFETRDNKKCLVSTVVVLRADSPGKAAQWFAESIPES